MEVLNKEKVLEHAKQLIDEGKIDRAIVEYQKLLEIDPKDMRIKLRVAELLARQKKINEAVKVYNEVAEGYTIEGFYLKAVTVYKNILRLNPSLVGINYSLAELYEKMGLNKDAIHQYQIIANSFEQKGGYEDLLEVRKKMVELDPHNSAGRIRLAETYQYMGKEEEAIDEYEKIIKEIKGVAKTDQLIELYEKVLSYRSENVEMLRALCQIYYKRGEWKKIIARLDKKDSLLKNETDLILMQAEIYARLNQIETAKGKYKTVAEHFLNEGDIDKALDAYKNILVISSDSEDEVKELVGGIDPDFFEKVRQEAVNERQRISEKLSEAERTINEAGAEGLPERGGRVRFTELSGEEVSEKMHAAESAFELGKAYYQMGLPDEAGPELGKCLNIYKELKAAGHLDKSLLDRISEIEKWLGIGEGPGPDDTMSLGGLDEDSMKKVKKDHEEKIQEKKDKPEAEAKRKKRDKRIGFV